MPTSSGDVRVEGLRQLRSTMRKAGLDLQDLKDAHAAAASIVTDAATRRVPVRSGKLRDSIRPAGTQSAAIIRAGYARVPYANPIHWGWPARGIPANPFISDAATSTEPEWVELYDKALGAIINQIEGK